MTVSSDRIVAVTGATGRQGGAVTRHLLVGGWQVRALTRKPEGEPARKLAALGAEVVRADMADPSTLTDAFRDAYGIYSVQNTMISGAEAEIRQGKNVAIAAKEASVHHVVYGSAGQGVPGTGVPSWESKLAVEAYMHELGLPLTVLRPMAFMELMTDKEFFPPVSAWHLMPKLMGAHRPLPWICVDDLGAIATRAFGDPDRFIGAGLKLAADICSIAECREIWTEIMGRAPRRFRMPIWLFKRFVGTDLITMWRWLRTGQVDVDPLETHEILPAALTVRKWMVGRRTQVKQQAR
jgi:uncharacterized protein YbjT (DUF2867 family)